MVDQAVASLSSEPLTPSEWSTPVQFVKGVGPRVALTLQKLGLQTVQDLLYHFPHRYEDRSNFRPLRLLAHGETVCTSGTLVGLDAQRAQRRNLWIIKAMIKDETGAAELVFFNQFWLRDVMGRLKGKPISVYGTVQRSGGLPQFHHPDWEELVDEGDSIHVNRIVPIHPLTEGLSVKTLRQAIYNAVEPYARLAPDLLPVALKRRLDLMEVGEALVQIHYPDNKIRLEEARRRLVFDELFLLQTALALRKH